MSSVAMLMCDGFGEGWSVLDVYSGPTCACLLMMQTLNLGDSSRAVEIIGILYQQWPEQFTGMGQVRGGDGRTIGGSEGSIIQQTAQHQRQASDVIGHPCNRGRLGANFQWMHVTEEGCDCSGNLGRSVLGVLTPSIFIWLD
jgi:hypothetical protein